MDIVALCPLAVGGYAWQPRFGGHAFVVIAKATFALGQGTARLADLQDGLVHGDGHWDDDPERSVYVPSDMAPFKESADVTLVGDAYAPIRGGARRLSARLCTGSIDKRVSVVCDRLVDEAGRIRLGKPFQRMALRYERAARSATNPVGVNEDLRQSGTAGMLPNLEPTSRLQAGAPACFAPVAANWQARQQLLGGARRSFGDRSWRSRPLPAEVDVTYFNDAPSDQRLEELHSDQTLLLENLHPHLPRLSCSLPGMRPRAFFEGAGAAREVALTADTLWIDMTRSACTLTWRGSIELDPLQHSGRVLVALEHPGERLIWPDVAEMLRTGSDRPSSPFALASEVPPAPPSDSQVRLSAAEAPALPYQLAVGADCGETQAIRRRVPSDALPFAPPAVEPFMAKQTSHQDAASLQPAPLPSLPTGPASASSPWARGLSQAHHTLRPPPSPPPPSITPPPLLLVPPPKPPPPARSSVSEPAQPDALAPLQAGERLEVLGQISSEIRRIRAHFKPLADEPEADPLARQLREAFGGSEPIEPAVARRQVVRVMTRGRADSAAAMQRAVSEAVDDDGVYHPPLALAHGSLRLAFDETEALKASMACVAPYLKGNPRLAEDVQIARELLDQGLADSPDVVMELTERITASYVADEAIDSAKVAARIERVLLSRRHYQRRSLLGGKWIRALLELPGAKPLPCYIPLAFAEDIPLFASFNARIVGELHPQQDQYESNSRALRVIALGRVIAAHKDD